MSVCISVWLLCGECIYWSLMAQHQSLLGRKWVYETRIHMPRHDLIYIPVVIHRLTYRGNLLIVLSKVGGQIECRYTAHIQHLWMQAIPYRQTQIRTSRTIQSYVKAKSHPNQQCKACKTKSKDITAEACKENHPKIDSNKHSDHILVLTRHLGFESRVTNTTDISVWQTSVEHHMNTGGPAIVCLPYSGLVTSIGSGPLILRRCLYWTTDRWGDGPLSRFLVKR